MLSFKKVGCLFLLVTSAIHAGKAGKTSCATKKKDGTSKAQKNAWYRNASFAEILPWLHDDQLIRSGIGALKERRACLELGCRHKRFFRKSANLLHHLALLPNPPKPYICPDCHKHYRTRTELIIHNRDGNCN